MKPAAVHLPHRLSDERMAEANATNQADLGRGKNPQYPAAGCCSPSSTHVLDVNAILMSLGEAAYHWDMASGRLTWSSNALAVLQMSDPVDIASGSNFARLVVQGGQSRADAILRPTARDGGGGVAYQVQYGLQPPNGRPLWIEDSGRWFAGPDGKAARAQGIVRVINERHEREQTMAYLSRHDALTGEMNGWAITEMLAATLDEAVKLRSSCGFMLAAIDNLGRINEAYGYDVAEEVIVGIARRLRTRMRGTDHLGRLSGNKFGMILKNCTPDDLIVAAERLLAGTRDEVVQTSVGPVAVTITLGGVTAPRYARTTVDVITKAQEGLDNAKTKRRGSFQAYAPNPERDARRRENARATDTIITALNQRNIFLVYEPVVAISSRQPSFYECLMRVRRPDGSLLAVNQAVPLAERLGLVRLLDHRVLELVLQELIAAPLLKASLNVSAASTIDPDWWSSLCSMLRANEGVAQRLTVEITETTAIENVEDACGFVARVKNLGCRIAIDDFGAGHTSFRNLRKLGVDLVKIDGSFVQNLKGSEDDRTFVRTLIELAKRLGLETVAEWVQDEQSASILADWGCNYIQGALVGLAMPNRPWMDTSASVVESA